jgi:hypothetical protein
MKYYIMLFYSHSYLRYFTYINLVVFFCLKIQFRFTFRSCLFLRAIDQSINRSIIRNFYHDVSPVSDLPLCLSTGPRWSGGPHLSAKNVYDGFLLMWCNLKFVKYYVILGKTCTLRLQQTRYITKSPNPPNTVLHRSHNEA